MIEVESLSKTYGSTQAIRDVTFQVEAGEILGFLGPNGAGKTTTMRVLAGYLPATGGTARVAGFDVHEHSMAVRQRIGYLPETPPLYPDMTVEGFLHFVGRIKGVASGSLAERAVLSMERCGLLHRRQDLIHKLSKGYRQRVGIAQAIIHDPPVIILDEPTVGLDPRQITEVRELIKSLAGDHTIILSTHILPEVSVTCDRVAIINNGEIIATDTPSNLMNRMSGEISYTVEISGSGETARSTLADLVGVRQINSLGTTLAGRPRFKVMLESERDIGGAISAAIVGADLELYELRRHRASLEEVFLNLTTQDDSVPSETFSSETSDSDTPDSEAPDAEALAAETLESETLDAQASAAESPDTEPADAEASDTEPADAEALTAEAPESESSDSDIETSDAESDDSDIETSDVEASDSKAMESLELGESTEAVKSTEETEEIEEAPAAEGADETPPEPLV